MDRFGDDWPDAPRGTAARERKFDTDYYSDLHAEGRYESMTTVEVTDFDNRPCYKIRLLRKNASKTSSSMT